MAVIGLLAAAGCAKEEPPPGTHPDSRPPRVAEISPGRDTVVPGFDGTVTVSFDEPIRAGADLERQVVGSPADRYRVGVGFSELRIRPSEAWKPAVYCFHIPAGIVDLLRNRTEEPIDFCFSTGPPVSPTEVSGAVTDRVTGAPVRSARILFWAAEGDSIPYTAVSDAEGTFRLRSLPPGTYDVFGFEDRNRDLRLQRRQEAYDSLRLKLDGPDARVELSLALLEPDSTPPALTVARALDSLTVRLEFDDPLPREQPPSAEVTVRDSTGRVLELLAVTVGEPGDLPPPEPEEEPEEAAEEEAPEEEPGEPVVPDPAGRETPDLPSRAVSLRLARPLVEGLHRVEARGWVNLWGLAGGGDTTFVWPRAIGPDAAGRRPPPDGEPPR